MNEQIKFYSREEAEEEATRMGDKKDLKLVDDYDSAQKMIELEDRAQNNELKAGNLFQEFREKMKEAHDLIISDPVKAGPQINNLKKLFGRINKQYGESRLGALEKVFFGYLEELEKTEETIGEIQKQAKRLKESALNEINSFKTSLDVYNFDLAGKILNSSEDANVIITDFLKYLADLDEKTNGIEDADQRISEQRTISRKIKKLTKLRVKISKYNDKTTEDDLNEKIKAKMYKVIGEIDQFKEELK
jgi:hypothetical protein